MATVLTERSVADAIVGIVCACGPPRHVRGFPECATARRAALVVLAMHHSDGTDSPPEQAD